MSTKRKNPFKQVMHSSPWIILGSVAILLITVIVLAVQNYNREKLYMSRILSEKGAALIKGLEAGSRTGMMGMMWGGQQIQTLIEETALLPDVLYIMITTREGLVLAGSQSSFIGTVEARPYFDENDLSDEIHWKMIHTENNQRAFEVYKYFRPISGRDNRMNDHMRQFMRRRAMMPGSGNEWCFPSSTSGQEQIILVGLDPAPFVDARKEDIRNTVIISGVLVILGLAGFISMFWMHSYHATKKSLQDTSAVADEVVTSLPVGLIATDKDKKIAFCNSAAERITGLDLSQARGKYLESIFPGPVSGLSESLDRGESIIEKEMECEFIREKIVPVSVSASKIINEEGQFIGQVLIIRDLREVRRLQEEILRKETLVAIGGLAAGVAHEIRNPLSSIKGIASYFKDKFEDSTGDKEMAGVMIQEVDRLNRVISELLEFARPTDLNLQKTDMNSLIEHSVKLIEKEASAKGISIEVDLLQQSLMAEFDSDRFSQCLLNLYLNALQSMEKGGRLSISADLTNKDTIGIDIKDTGSGIQPENLKQIFDPYYTTKSKGTGLGLAIVHKIVEAHHGQIQIHSVPGQGTTVTVRIPVGNS